jgi:hypothetical protein
MKRIVQLGCLAIAILLHPTFAAADSLTYSSLGSGSWVTLQLGSVTETGWAGEIKWLYKTPTDAVGTLVTTYCGDLFDDAKLPIQTVTTTTTAALDASIAASSSISINALPHAGGKAAWLVNNYGAGARSSNDAAAGLQLAVWQAMFGAGSFTYSASTGVTNAANMYFGYLTDALAANQSAVLSSTSTYFDVNNDAAHTLWNAFGQDQIIGSPEPSTVILLLFAMAAALTYQYRLQRRVSVARVSR